MYMVGAQDRKLFTAFLHFECEEAFSKMRARGDDVELNHDYYRGTSEPR